MSTKMPDRDDVRFQRSEVARLTTAIEDAEAEVARMTTLAESMRRQVEERITERDEAFAALSLPKPGIPQVSVLSRLLAAESWRLHTLAGGTTLSETEEAMAKVVAQFEQKVAALEAEVTRLRERLRKTAQTIIAAIGADGPQNAEEAAERIVSRLAELESDVTRLREERDKATALAASYDRQDELLGTEFEGVDEVTDVIRLLKQEREATQDRLASLEQRQRELVAKWQERSRDRETYTAAVRWAYQNCADELKAALKQETK